MTEFKVLREHLGDKPYVAGDVRDARAEDVAHLVANGVLVPMEAEDKPVPQAKSPRVAKAKVAK